MQSRDGTNLDSISERKTDPRIVMKHLFEIWFNDQLIIV